MAAKNVGLKRVGPGSLGAAWGWWREGGLGKYCGLREQRGARWVQEGGVGFGGRAPPARLLCHSRHGTGGGAGTAARGGGPAGNALAGGPAQE